MVVICIKKCVIFIDDDLFYICDLCFDGFFLLFSRDLMNY